MGAVGAVQSAFARQATQVRVLVLQRGVAVAPQSVLVSHWTHCFAVGSQMGRAVPQFIEVWQPMHAPLAVSQMGVTPAH